MSLKIGMFLETMPRYRERTLSKDSYFDKGLKFEVKAISML
jgi:hypothetical protein